MLCNPVRARTVVVLASKQTKVAALREWLRCDERGVHEAYADRLLTAAIPRGADAGLTDAQIDEACAVEVVIAAATAMISRFRLTPATEP